MHVEARVSDHIRTFLANLLPYPQPRERRCDVRYPFPFLITLTPVGQDNVTPVHEPITVVGKSVSAR
ncbi:MAG: hypothetical protein A2W31_00665 [Planctomycetes bacterium RBG_16_64_10]|nr:MAG: hypothetical protein A2W31_00665 [Planctomycetes bacterium RBG_16_64_10]